MQPLPLKLVKLLLGACLVLANTQLKGVLTHHQEWHYNDPHYASAHYESIMGREKLPNFQYQYVDYQPDCGSGGEGVCATNGRQYFYFENACKLEAHNTKLIFQYGTELEPTEVEHCRPNCEQIRCSKLYQPVCAVPADAAKATRGGVTFGNECEVKRHECITQQVMRIVKKAPCQELKRKRKQRKNRTRKGKNRNARKNYNTTGSPKFIPSTTEASKMYVLLATALIKPTTTTAAPMRYLQIKSLATPVLSVSRAENAYSVYNIPDVGQDYEAITDSKLSVYLPGVGYVTDIPRSTSTTTKPTNTSTTTLKLLLTTSTTPEPSTSSTPATTSASVFSTNTTDSVVPANTTKMMDIYSTTEGSNTSFGSSFLNTVAPSTTLPSTVIKVSKNLDVNGATTKPQLSKTLN